MCNNESSDRNEWCFNKQYTIEQLKPYFVNPEILLKQHEPNKPRSYLLNIFGFLSFFFLAITLIIHGKYQCSKGYKKSLAYTILAGEFFLVFVNCILQAYILRIHCFDLFISIALGAPLLFLGVLGKMLLLYTEYINTLKKEKINSSGKFNDLFLKSDLNNINSEALRDNSSSSRISFSSIPRDLPFMKHITERNILIVIYFITVLCVIYAYIAQSKSLFYRINTDDYGYCNHGPWEFIPLYVILYGSTIFSTIIYCRILYLRNRKVKVSKKMIFYLLFGLFLFILYLGFSYSPTLHFKFFFVTREMILSIFVIYVHVLFIGGPVYRMLNMVYLQENLNKSMDSLKFVLDNPELCNEFSKYCSIELCIENLLFHKRVTKLKEEISEYEDIKLHKSKREVYEYEREKLSKYKKYEDIKLNPIVHEEGGLDIIYEYYNDFYNKQDKYLNGDFSGMNMNMAMTLNSNSHLNDFDEITSYRNTVNNDYIPILFINDVNEIYKKYIAHDSIFEINISNGIYQKISHEINHGDENFILKSIFDDADKEVLNILYTNIYGKFIKTQKNKKLFDDLELMINKSPEE
ncbi:hypothetical protein H8356DRAFT_1658530 [Neocallimastix lanati (nom. inval.)]|jgi:hypothetical protein|uniref:RGS domain-containing protein n=1 Tax=Neocallimastix californiae TaxID=1754190 RepID=A0A1Y1Z2V2_9FUNG|nr:hypothetical protein H8356DRAFT_1658530 [Neocallimastix sp. JGI-2020a]ORY04529.1 hypothetical protein LY90DRAFT_678509 [Neocallimastix californiae]|eukprot:ORY04529.1 hypothetical protein LY90DRAFT_678509 [Neocallimastix californiae]